MKLIASKRPPTEKLDQLKYVRDDGSSCSNAMPRQGVLPHDLIHYVVESALGLNNGFLSLVARGANAVFVMEQTHGPNQAEVARQAVQAEALVEALQTQLWAGAFDRESFLYGVATATQSRGVEAPSFGEIDLEARLFAAAVELNQRWQQVPAYGSMELIFDLGEQR